MPPQHDTFAQRRLWSSDSGELPSSWRAPARSSPPSPEGWVAAAAGGWMLSLQQDLAARTLSGSAGSADEAAGRCIRLVIEHRAWSWQVRAGAEPGVGPLASCWQQAQAATSPRQPSARQPRSRLPLRKPGGEEWPRLPDLPALPCQCLRPRPSRVSLPTCCTSCFPPCALLPCQPALRTHSHTSAPHTDTFAQTLDHTSLKNAEPVKPLGSPALATPSCPA